MNQSQRPANYITDIGNLTQSSKKKYQRTNISRLNNHIDKVVSSTALNQNLLNQIELMDKAGVDFNMPEKPILSRNGQILQQSTPMMTNDYLNQPFTDVSIDFKLLVH